MIRRREFITRLGDGAAWPLAARAQQQAMPVIGYLNAGSPERTAGYLAGFRQGLKETGYVEGQNVAIEYRWAQGRYDQLPALAADRVRNQVAVIAAPGGTPQTMAAKAATTTIPIVFYTGADPVQLGLVASLNRPGGNLTGVTTLNSELAPKRLQLLRELLPAATNIGLLVNPGNAVFSDALLQDMQAAAGALGMRFDILYAKSEIEIDTAFARLLELKAGALDAIADPFFNNHLEQIAALALRHAIPSIYSFRDFPVAGGLMSYGTNQTDAYRQVGVQTGLILKGERPKDLPVQQAAATWLGRRLSSSKRVRPKRQLRPKGGMGRVGGRLSSLMSFLS
jgi:putative ABC transport system substrate-binding protein